MGNIFGVHFCQASKSHKSKPRQVLLPPEFGSPMLEILMKLIGFFHLSITPNTVTICFPCFPLLAVTSDVFVEFLLGIRKPAEVFRKIP